MSYINMKSRRSFDFAAPYNEEGDRVVTIPFPVAVIREVSEDGTLVHDANPALVSVAPTEVLDIDVETKVQAGSFMIVSNAGTAVATVGGANCDAQKVSTLMFDGNAYVVIATSDIA